MKRRAVSPLALVVMLLLAGTTLSACDRSGEPPAGAGQALVRVNGDEITLHQINYVLARLPKGQTADPELMRKIVEQYIDQQLLLQQALESGLHRDADVVQTLEQVRRQVLAQTYLERAVGAVAPPSEKEIDTYYRRHPELFAERKRYRLQQWEVGRTAPPAELARLVQASNVRAPQLIGWLKARNALASVQHVTLPAEQLPLELVPRLHGMKRGERLVWNRPEGTRVLVLVGTESQPLDRRQARAAIEKYLLAETRRARGDQELQRLRDQARVEWLQPVAVGRHTALQGRSSAAGGQEPEAAALQGRSSAAGRPEAAVLKEWSGGPATRAAPPSMMPVSTERN